MRGIEAALYVWKQVRHGAFASESIRKISERMSENDRTLTATLIYAVLRRESLWDRVIRQYLKPSPSKFSRDVVDALTIGAAGILELRTFSTSVLVNALVDWTKKQRDYGGAKVVNAVLRRIAREGPDFLADLERDNSLSAAGLICGTPEWIAKIWQSYWGVTEAKKLMNLLAEPVGMSFRLSPGVDAARLISRCRNAGYEADVSDLLESSIRMKASVHPPSVPGFAAGEITPQSESSMMIGLVAKSLWKDGPILDMCAGRGIKTGHMAQLIPDATIEAWDLSPHRVRAGEREMHRLGVEERVTYLTGDALELAPGKTPSLILLDAPCSGSGTWSRHPEAKWRLSVTKLKQMADLQKKLLSRAVSIVAPGGFVIYGTCSLLKDENEQVVADVMSRNDDLVEMTFPLSLDNDFLRSGRPWGDYVWPSLPWLDGFFMTIMMRKKQED